MIVEANRSVGHWRSHCDARRNMTGIPDHQRHMNLFPIECLAMSPQMMLPQRFAMIGRDDHQRIVRQTAPAQFFHQLPDVVIHVLHAVVVCVQISLLRP